MTLEERYYKELHGSYFRIHSKIGTNFNDSPDFHFNGLSGDKVILKWKLRVLNDDGSIDSSNEVSDNYNLERVFIYIDSGDWVLCNERKRDNSINDLLE